jgi:hypothetical protein
MTAPLPPLPPVRLTPDDADQLEDTAWRARRCAETAHRVSGTDPDLAAAALLADLASQAHAMADAALAVAHWIRANR